MKQIPFYLIRTDHPENPIPLTESLTLGSSQDCSVQVTGPNISPRQCRLEFKGFFVVLRNFTNEHPTLLNGNTLSTEKILRDGDLITVGDETFTFSTSPVRLQDSLGLRSKNEEWSLKLKELGAAAKTDFPVLLLGPSGTGKEVLAEAIHKHSLRSKGPLVSVNCSALSESLIESELFGHVKGSFTGASQDRKGAFEAARGGTLFLDEIGDLPLSLQAKLLRALENHEIRPVGSDRNVQTDVRIIAATHQNLPLRVKLGQFRSDLFHRLNVIQTVTPSLTDRKEDFEDLCNSFARKMGLRINSNGMKTLKSHSWPGNIRELRNTLSRAKALYPDHILDEGIADRIIDRSLVTTSIEAPKAQIQPQRSLSAVKEYEKSMILKKLIEHQGNQRRAAVDLGLAKSTLNDKIREYGICAKSIAKQAKDYFSADFNLQS
jgi:DNA-binding NtrC family response regulator